ncbi:MarR family transcriptional regulator [Thauera humireducens]|uniref:MarR family transcriptional regulator n=1 Tax=Thauera humireducens TaxID=1134435 RepID=UPI003C70B160
MKKAVSQVTPLSVLQRFRVLIRTAQRHSQWIERQSGVTGAQLWALQELAEVRACVLANLRTAWRCIGRPHRTWSTASGDCSPDPQGRTSADQRVVRLYLTEAGTALLARAPSPARGVLPEALRLLDPEALARLQGELDGLLLQIRDLDEGFGMQPLPFTE